MGACLLTRVWSVEVLGEVAGSHGVELVGVGFSRYKHGVIAVRAC